MMIKKISYKSNIQPSQISLTDGFLGDSILFEEAVGSSGDENTILPLTPTTSIQQNSLLSNSLLSSFVASPSPDRAISDGSDEFLKEVKTHCLSTLTAMKELNLSNDILDKIASSLELGSSSVVIQETAEHLATSIEKSEEIDLSISPEEAAAFKKILAAYAIQNELVDKDYTNYCKIPLSLEKLDEITPDTQKAEHITLLPYFLIQSHAKIVTTLFKLCFPDVNIIASWDKFSSETVLINLWDNLNKEKDQDLPCQDFFQVYFPYYSLQTESHNVRLKDLLPIDEESSESEDSSKDASYDEKTVFFDPENSEEEESSSLKNFLNIKFSLALNAINDSDFTNKILAQYDDSSAEPQQVTFSELEVLPFLKLICSYSFQNIDLINSPALKEQIECKNIQKVIVDQSFTQSFAKDVLLNYAPQYIITLFFICFPNTNITESWHLLFPDLSIKQLWGEEKFKEFTLKEFCDNCFGKDTMPTATEIQQYKTLAMLKSAKKSADFATTSLYQSTCDNSLGISALPDTTSEDFKTVFNIAINQAGNPELAKKILEYNYPEDNFSAAPEVENNRENQEVVLSKEEAQFLRNFVCAMILQDNPASMEKIWQEVQEKAKNHEINIPDECPFVKGGKSTLTEGANVGNFADKDSIILLSNRVLNKQPRDVAQWFEMCFPNVHLPKSWEAVFPDISISELWQGRKILAADTFSKFCQIVFPNYELSEDNLQPGQKENLDLFLNYGPGDKFDIGKENLSSDFENLFAETTHTSALNEPAEQPLAKSTSEDSLKSTIEEEAVAIINDNIEQKKQGNHRDQSSSNDDSGSSAEEKKDPQGKNKEAVKNVTTPDSTDESSSINFPNLSIDRSNSDTKDPDDPSQQTTKRTAPDATTSDEGYKSDNNVPNEMVNSSTSLEGATLQEPIINKGFLSGLFSSFAGFVTASIFSAVSGLSALFGLKKAAPTPEGTITPNHTENSNEPTKTISNGDNTTPTPTTNSSEAPTPESKSFVGIIYDSIFSMFHAIGSRFGESHATALDPEQLNDHTTVKVIGETTDDNCDNPTAGRAIHLT